jgi:heme oxygenase (biliverdin-IX-beta and delta-forming)
MIGPDVRRLLRRARSAALATALADGTPYASLVTVACDVDARPILLFSDLSDHTRNLARDPRASLLIEAASRRYNPQTGPRVSLVGRVGRADDPRLKRRFLARHPSAALYADFADFHIYHFDAERAHLVGGFGRAAWLDAAEVILAPADVDDLGAAEEEILLKLNGPLATVVDRAAERFGHSGDGWSAIAVDGDGVDLRRGRALGRLDLAPPLRTAADVEEGLRRAAGGG